LCHLALRFPQVATNFRELDFLHLGPLPCMLFYITTVQDMGDLHFPLQECATLPLVHTRNDKIT
jgi:hypothetical protein